MSMTLSWEQIEPALAGVDLLEEMAALDLQPPDIVRRPEQLDRQAAVDLAVGGQLLADGAELGCLRGASRSSGIGSGRSHDVYAAVKCDNSTYL